MYRHIRPDKNEPFYIGVGSDKTHKRAFGTNPRSAFWKRVAAKGCVVEIMLDDISWEEACEKEKYFIELYGRADLGTGSLVNMTSGGEGTIGRVVTQEAREKMSENSRRLWDSGVFTQEVFKKQSETKKQKYASGELVPHNKGKRKTVEPREKKQISAEQETERIRKILKAREWYEHTDETKRKISETLKAKHLSGELASIGNYNLGRKLSEETRSKMSIAKRAMWDAIKNKKQ